VLQNPYTPDSSGQDFRVLSHVERNEEFASEVNVGTAVNWIALRVTRSLQCLPECSVLNNPTGFPKVKGLKEVGLEERDLRLTHASFDCSSSSSGKGTHMFHHGRVKDHYLVFLRFGKPERICIRILAFRVGVSHLSGALPRPFGLGRIG
jgi:hypothetical protein